MKRLISPAILRLGQRTLARVFKPDVRDEVRDELEFHVAMKARDLMLDGVPPDQAKSIAREQFKDMDQIRSDLEGIGSRRDQHYRRREMWSEVVRDIRYSFRQLRRAPGFAAVAVITLALGIGANSAVFSVVNGVLLRPLPYADAHELVNVSTAFPTMDFDRFWFSPPEYFELREWNQVFEDMGGYRTGTVPVETYDRPIEVPSAVATYSLFSTLGVEAFMGRTFSQEEDLPGAEPVVLISRSLWESAFGADPEILGKTIRVQGNASTVVGVLPAEFDLDDAGVDLISPVGIDPADRVNRRGNHFLNVVGRMADGVTLERVQADLDRIELHAAETVSGHRIDVDFHPVTAYSFTEDALGNARQAMVLLMGAVFFVLLIACANVANLLLARAQTRSKEVAVRVAMGAGRGRLIRQLLAEGLALATVGGVLGLLLGKVAVDLLLTINPEGVPRAEGIGLDGTVAAFTMAVALTTGLVFGLAPLMNTGLSSLSKTLRDGGTRTTKGGPGVSARRMLVVAEVALAVVLVTGSGLLIRSMSALQSVELGFRAENLLTMRYNLARASYPETHDVTSFQSRFLERVSGLPGVVSASAVSGLPPIRNLDANDTDFEGVERTEDGPAHNVDYWSGVDLDYVETMDIAVLEGRSFEPQDILGTTPVAMVNQRLAQTFYPGQSPVGRRVRPGGGDDTPWFTIVGVVADVPLGGVGEEQGTELLLLNPQLGQSGAFVYRTMHPVIRVDGDPLLLTGQIRGILQEMDPTLALSDVQSMEQNIEGTMAEPRFMTLLMGVFALVALSLAAVGTYGVMAYNVAERNREIGIRMAMGAEAGSVQGLVLRQGGFLAVVGLALGVAGAYSLSQLLSSQLYEVSTTDPTTFVVAPLVLALIALFACWIPARRATKVDPVVVLGEA